MNKWPISDFAETDRISSAVAANTVAEKKLNHLLSRCLIGFTVHDLEYYRGKTIHGIVDELFQSPGENGRPLKDYSASSANQPDSQIEQGDSWVEQISFDPLINAKRKSTLKSWLVAVYQACHLSLKPQMTLFWRDYFAIDNKNVIIANHLYEYYDNIINHSTGNFKDILIQQFTGVALYEHFKKKRPAVESLANFFSKSLLDHYLFGEPCETYISKDRIKRFTKMMNKWTQINDKILVSLQEYHAKMKINGRQSHFDDLLLLPNVDKAIIRDYLREFDRFLGKLLLHEKVAYQLCVKIFKWFVHDALGEDEKQNIIAPMIRAFKESNFEIKAVLRSLFLNPFFYNPKYIGSMVKRPEDFVFGIFSALDLVRIDQPFQVEHYSLWEWLQVKTESMSVKAGEDAYQHNDEQLTVPGQQRWLNPAFVIERNMMALQLIDAGINLGNKQLKINAPQFLGAIPEAADLTHFINAIFMIFYKESLSEETLRELKRVITTKYAMDDAEWKAFHDGLATLSLKDEVLSRMNAILKDLIKHMLYLSRYQFM